MAFRIRRSIRSLDGMVRSYPWFGSFHMKYAISILALAIGLSVSSKVVACSCDLPPVHQSLKQQVTKARNSSSAVFSGVVLKIDEAAYSVRVTFKVDEYWKRQLSTQVIVVTGRGGGDCGYRFEVGQRYLVYAYGSDVTSLGTNICQRTAPYSDGAADLKVLGRSKRPVG